MLFNSLPYFILLSTTALLFFALPPRGRLLLLPISSAIFYAFWSVPFLSLIVIQAAVDFTAGVGIQRVSRPAARRAFLIASLATNLGILGYFKYANFFLDNIHRWFGLGEGFQAIDVILPPGISFYTFQSMSYTIDVYRGQLTPTRSFARFFRYVMFFPQLMAGPIERAGHLMCQFDHAARQRFNMSNLIEGSRMILWGLFKKVIIADYCALVADRVYDAPTGFDGWSALVGTYAFTLQIYCDFSAYSEIARGSARIFGIDLMRNFDQPYLSANIQDFWRRWHISLSNWIRDYVYIPLGGNRKGRVRTFVNLVVTMFLAGLWHGAAWNFVLWGLYHGMLLMLHALIAPRVFYGAFTRKMGNAWPFVSWLATFHLAVIGWILFRVKSVGDFGVILSSIGNAFATIQAPTPDQAWFLVFVALFLLASHASRKYNLTELLHRNLDMSIAFYAAVVVMMAFFARSGGPQFIYFQF